MDIIAEIEKKYDIKIYIELDEDILTDDIVVGKMGKLSNRSSKKLSWQTFYSLIQ